MFIYLFFLGVQPKTITSGPEAHMTGLGFSGSGQFRLVAKYCTIVLTLTLIFQGHVAMAQTEPNNPAPAAKPSLTDSTRLQTAKPEPDSVDAKFKAMPMFKPIVLADTSLDGKMVEKVRPSTSPRKAALYSAILPGLGQFYNRKYWKIPIIYAGALTAIYAFNFNNTEYQRFREAYILRRNGDLTSNSLYQFYPDINQLSNARDFYRYYRDFSVILGLMLYGLQMADAAVDAHLMSFSVKDDLTLTIAPKMHYMHDGSQTMGMALQFRLGK